MRILWSKYDKGKRNIKVGLYACKIACFLCRNIESTETMTTKKMTTAYLGLGIVWRRVCCVCVCVLVRLVKLLDAV